MATIKSYTDISQSKTLSKILPLESADMYYDNIIDSVTRELFIPADGSTIKIGKGLGGSIAAWSLAALLGVLPYPHIEQNYKGKWTCRVEHGNTTYLWEDSNPVDACMAMIEELNKLKML